MTRLFGFTKTISLFLILGILFFIVPQVEAHVVVKPNQAGIASYQIFSVGVPNEKDTPVVELKLLIPDGVKSVSPNVKPGWTISLQKSDTQVTEINWTGGEIPPDQRDDFLFSVQVPAKTTTLNWKAYQTYADGTVVSWDQNPSSMKHMSDDKMEELETEGKGPYSQTKIVNDLGTTSSTTHTMAKADDTHTMLIAYVALALSALSLGLQLKKRI